MNNVIKLNPKFISEPFSRKLHPNGLPNRDIVTAKHMRSLLKNLVEIQAFWKNNIVLEGGILLSAFHTRLIPKSRRIGAIFSHKSNDFIVGAKFSSNKEMNHIITYFVPNSILQNAINSLQLCSEIIDNEFQGKIDNSGLELIRKEKISLQKYGIKKSPFIQFVLDIYCLEKFEIVNNMDEFNNETIITIYDTKQDTVLLFRKIGIEINSGNILDGTTILLEPDELTRLKLRAPYLISMGVENLTKMTKLDFLSEEDPRVITIPEPLNEPTIGVIDTLFDESVYFTDWVEYKKMIDPNIDIDDRDYDHGTAVTSIIVDGHTINPDLDDGCGRFKVRHFGVSKAGSFSSFSILKSIKEIIASNRDVKVWNISLGSEVEINKNFISAEAAVLDQIQYENDVIFVISGTNKPNGVVGEMALGSPADSVNSIVVNSVDISGKPASYTRRGPVLSFFNKPDVSYYGGTIENPVRVCKPNGEAYVKGTSFAAPWIARKLSYLIDIIGLSREVAKALIIDSTTSWEQEKIVLDERVKKGHGIVPININNIIQSKSDEIRFFMTGNSEQFHTYFHRLPIPTDKDKFPYVSKITLCYFPNCSRNNGVDYTNTELKLKFGRLNHQSIKKIASINMEILESNPLYEKSLRKLLRKWDNSKHFKEVLKSGSRPKKIYDNRMWGIGIESSPRLGKRKEETNVKFGIVVTLKEINNVNRIHDFVRACSFIGISTEQIRVDERIDIYNKSQEEIQLG